MYKPIECLGLHDAGTHHCMLDEKSKIGHQDGAGQLFRLRQKRHAHQSDYSPLLMVRQGECGYFVASSKDLKPERNAHKMNMMDREFMIWHATLPSLLPVIMLVSEGTQ